MPRHLFLLTLVGCAGGNRPYQWCKGAYESIDAEASTTLGYSAQDAIDLLSLSHSGTLGWRQTEELDAPLPLPDDSPITIDLEVDTIRWGTYSVDTGGRLILATCPTEGLEVVVSGEIALAAHDTSFPVNGYLLAARYDDRDDPTLDTLDIEVRGEPTAEQVAFLQPTLDDLAAVHEREVVSVDAYPTFRWSADAEEVQLQLVWRTEDSTISGQEPIEAWIDFDR